MVEMWVAADLWASPDPRVMERNAGAMDLLWPSHKNGVQNSARNYPFLQQLLATTRQSKMLCHVYLHVARLLGTALDNVGFHDLSVSYHRESGRFLIKPMQH